MRGRSSPPMRSANWCSFLPAAPARTTTEANAWATISSPTRSWRCVRRRANASGISRRCITICGITMWPRRRFLFDVHRNGKTIPAIGVGSKTGHFFILNRETGEPIFGVEERPVPQSDVAGEVSSATQPFPLMPHALAPQKLAAEQVAGTAFGRSHGAGSGSPCCGVKASSRRPVDGLVDGSGECGRDGVGRRGIRCGRPVGDHPGEQPGCRSTFGTTRGFRNAGARGGPRSGGRLGIRAAERGTPTGGSALPAIAWRTTLHAPAMGNTEAIDVDTGEIRWTVPAGQFPAIGNSPGGPAAFGSIVLGGPIATAGGLVFMAGTLDSAIRAYDARTGKRTLEGRVADERTVHADDLPGEQRKAVCSDFSGRPRDSRCGPSGRLCDRVRAAVVSCLEYFDDYSWASFSLQRTSVRVDGRRALGIGGLKPTAG